MEGKKKNTKLMIIIAIAVVIVAVVGVVVFMSGNKGTQEEQKEIITGNWKVDVIQDNAIFERILDGFIYNWYSTSYYSVDNTLNDIKIFKDPNKDYYCWIANVNMYVKENYKSDGSMYYTRTNESSAQLKEIYLKGYCKFGENKAGELKTFNQNYTSTNVVEVYDSYENALNAILKLCEFSNENELTCIVDDTLIAEFKQKVKSNNNIYNEMENLLKAGKLDDAKNLYYKTPNTDLTKGQSEKCLLMYAKYSELKSWGGSSVDIKGNDKTNNENDYVIIVQSSGMIPKKVVYITVDVENKTYKTTKSI